jgi:hypothetical protein
MGNTRVVPGGSSGGMPGSGGWTGLDFWRFFSGRALATERHAPSLAQSHATALVLTRLVYARPAAISISTLMTSRPSASNSDSRAWTSSRTARRLGSGSAR